MNMLSKVLTDFEYSELEGLKSYARNYEVDVIKVEKAYLALDKYRDYICHRAKGFNAKYWEQSNLSPVYLFMADCITAYFEFQEDRITEKRVEDINNEHTKHVYNLIKKVRRAIESLPKPLSIKKLNDFLDDDVFSAHSPREIERLKNGLPETAKEIEYLISNIQGYRMIGNRTAFLESVLGSLKWWADIDIPKWDTSSSSRKNEHYLLSMLKEFDPSIEYHYESTHSREKERMYRSVSENYIGYKYIKPKLGSFDSN